MIDTELKDIFKKSCNEMCDFAVQNCCTDYVDEKNGCSWYHCAWAYLRLLDCVSAPQWHENNYRTAIRKCLDSFHKPIQLLISGTADYSMLHLIIDELYSSNSQANIYILDKCPSPLHLCNDYIKKYVSSEKKQFIQYHTTIKFIEEDILRTGLNHFDIICTDAFLTRFNYFGAASVIKKWYEMLNQCGVILTTVRIHNSTPEANLLSVSKSILKFEKKVSDKYDKYITENNDFPIAKEKLLYLANRYIIKMVSNSLGSEEDITELFNPKPSKERTLDKRTERFELSSQKVEVQGEIEKTEYLFIEARRKKC